MELTTNHTIYYSNKNHIAISEIAESLVSLEDVIKQTPKVFEELFPGTQIQNVEVFVSEIKAGSLWEDIVVKFVFGNQEKFDLFISNLREKLGMEYLTKNPQLLSAIILSLVFTGGIFYLSKEKGPTSSETKQLEANNNVIINIGAGMVDMTPDDFKAIVESAVRDRDKLAKDAVAIVKPAKSDPKATITFDQNENLQVQQKSVSAMPAQTAPIEEEESIKDFDNVYIEIRATDLDSTKKGWAAVIPDISDKRTRLQLDPTIRPTDVLAKQKFNGTVTAVYKTNKSGKKIPSLYFLREIESSVQLTANK